MDNSTNKLVDLYYEKLGELKKLKAESDQISRDFAYNRIQSHDMIMRHRYLKLRKKIRYREKALAELRKKIDRRLFYNVSVNSTSTR